jgi:hypothetical protein
MGIRRRASGGEDLQDAQGEVFGDLQILPEISHRNVGEDVHVQRGRAELREADACRGGVHPGVRVEQPANLNEDETDLNRRAGLLESKARVIPESSFAASSSPVGSW